MIRKLLLSGVSAAAIICANTAGAATFTFGFTGQVESGAIATSGTYELRLRGADGGGATGLSGNARGGFGALLLGEIDLLAGDLFRVLVGGNGLGGYGGGGGGLSYFSSGTNLAIAGGGGGASGSGSYYGTSAAGYDAAAASSYLGLGGSSNNYGYYFSFHSGGGGAGWEGNGRGDAGGQSGPGWAGGINPYTSGVGGFGGGGGTGEYYNDVTGGGGAGAFGGDAGRTDTFYLPPGDGAYIGEVIYGTTYGGRGGGSYFSSAFLNTSSVVGQARVGGAYLTLDLQSQPAPVPLPASAALLGSTIAGMGFVARRRKKKS